MANFILQGLGLRQPPAHQGQHPLAVFAQLQTPGMAHKQGGATSGLEFGQLAAELGLGALLKQGQTAQAAFFGQVEKQLPGRGPHHGQIIHSRYAKKVMPVLQKP